MLIIMCIAVSFNPILKDICLNCYYWKMGEVQFGKYEKIRLIDVCFNLATRKDGRKTIFISPTRKIIHTRVLNLHRSSFKAFLNKKMK